jgi:hypothetical protein
MSGITISPEVTQIVTRSRNLFREVLALGLDVAKAASAQATALPRVSLRPTCNCCDIPETECPTGCVCSMSLSAMTGQRVTARIRVVNNACEERTFNLSATPFTSNKDQSSFVMTPDSLTIPAGQSAVAMGVFDVPGSFAKGAYQSEILVRGAYEQCVSIALNVGCDEVLTGTCTVTQEERLFRIRAHNWYDHFQCVEPCGCAEQQRGVSEVPNQ